jgi:hypothetical protein
MRAGCGPGVNPASKLNWIREWGRVVLSIVRLLLSIAQIFPAMAQLFLGFRNKDSYFGRVEILCSRSVFEFRISTY